MCRNKDHGGRRCPRTSRTTQLNTINQRIRRNRIKADTLEDSPEKTSLVALIAQDEALKETLRQPTKATIETPAEVVSEESVTVTEDSPNTPDVYSPAETDEVVTAQSSAEKVHALLDKMREDNKPFKERIAIRRAWERAQEVERVRKIRPLSPLPAHKKKVSVFRAGAVEAPTERGVEKEVYEIADSIKPEGRVGRTEGIFAAPSLYGVTRWVRGASLSRVQDVSVREITVDPDKVYVYSVDAWEDGSWSTNDTDPASYQAFWDSGMTLRQWYERGVDDGDKWEMLLSPDLIQGVKNVTPKRVSQAAEETWRTEVLNLLRRTGTRR